MFITSMHANFPDDSNFKKLGMPTCGQHVPVFKKLNKIFEYIFFKSNPIYVAS